MRKILVALQGMLNPHFNSVPALPMGAVPDNELSPHQADLDREFAGYGQQLLHQENMGDDKNPLHDLPEIEIAPNGGRAGMDTHMTRTRRERIRPRDPDRTVISESQVESGGQWPSPTTYTSPALEEHLKGILDKEPVFQMAVPNRGFDPDNWHQSQPEEPRPLAMADDPNWKTHEPIPGKVVNDWVGEQTGPGAEFSRKIHSEFFATAWNWHRESAQNGKKNYHKHQRFFFLVGERLLNDDWREIEQLSKFGFVIGRERDEMRAAVVVNDVSVQIDLTHIKLELDRHKSPWTRPRQ